MTAKCCDFCGEPLPGTPLHVTITATMGDLDVGGISARARFERIACRAECAADALANLNAQAITSRHAREALLLKRNQDLVAQLEELEARKSMH